MKGVRKLHPEERDTSCKKCFGEIQDGSLCKRKASCQVGCKYFCWQHTKNVGGTSKKGECHDPKMSRCKINEENKFPCKKKITVFLNKEDFSEYEKMINIKKASGKASEIRKKKLAEVNEIPPVPDEPSSSSVRTIPLTPNVTFSLPKRKGKVLKKK